MAKYRVETDNGTYEVETDEASTDPGLLQQAGEVLSAPFRGTRALGVGAQHLIQKAVPGGENMPLGDILQRSAEAVKPGFEAKPGERIGSAIGVSGPALPLGAVAGLPGAAATAGVAALGKGSESLAEGKTATEAGQDAAIEGGLNLVAMGLATGVGAAGNAIIRNALARGKGLTREVVDAVLDNPMLAKSEGAKKAVAELRSAMVEAKTTAGKNIGAIRKGLGLADNVAETETRILSGEAGTVTPQEALKAAKEAMALTKATRQPGSQRLDELLKAKAQLREVQDFSRGAIDPKFKLKSTESVVFERNAQELDRLIDTIPGGPKLREAQEAYGSILKDFAEFSNRLQTEGGSEQFMRQAVKAGEDLTGRIKDSVDAMRRVEQRAGTNKLGKALQETAKEQFNKSSSGGVAGTIMETLDKTLGAKAVGVGAKLGTRFTKGVAKARAGASPLVRGITEDQKRKER